MKNRKRIIPVIIFLLLAGSIYWYYDFYSKDKTSPLEASGTIEATTVNLKAKLPGTIQELAAEEGDTTEKGELLAELYRSDLLAQKERDVMTVMAAEAKLNDLASGARVQEIKQAIAGVDMAQTAYEKAQADFNRAAELFNAGALAEEALENARVNVELKKKQLETAEEQLSLVKEGSRSGQIAAAAAELERSKAILKASQAMLDDLKIISPISGTVLNKNYEKGEFVSAGASIYTVADLSDLWIKVYIPTDDLPKIKLGQKVQCSVSGNSTIYPGKVIKIASQGEFTPKMIQTKKERTNIVFAVKIAVKNIDNRLKPGMPADVVIEWSEEN